MAPETIDTLIEEQISGGEASLKQYDGTTHQRMFHLTKGKITVVEVVDGALLLFLSTHNEPL